MDITRKLHLFLFSVFTISIFAIILNPTTSQATLTATIIRVATTGNDASGCGTEAAPCRTINYAVNSASSGDIILVADGTYSTRGNCVVGMAVICVFAKELTILGGYNTSNWNTADPVANPTIIDGQNSNRPILLDGRTLSYVPTIRLEGFTVQNGFVQGKSSGSNFDKAAFGGGMLGETGKFILRNMVFRNNVTIGGNATSNYGGAGSGGGLSLKRAVDGTLLEHITFDNNTAQGGTGPERGGYAIGGGLFTSETIAHGRYITFTNNLAQGGNSNGNGIDSQLGGMADAQGGGAAIQGGSTVIFEYICARGNSAIGGNAGVNAGGAFGGGIKVEGHPWLSGKTTIFTITDSLLENNLALGGDGQHGGVTGGGGLESIHSTVIVDRVIVKNNQSIGGDGVVNEGPAGGGGLYLQNISDGSSPVTVKNSVIVNNFANTGNGSVAMGGGGGGLWLQGVQATITHNTFAQNQLGDVSMQASGILIMNDGSVAASIVDFTYNIVADHTDPASSAALRIKTGNTATLNYNLFAGNSQDIINLGTLNEQNTLTSSSAEFVSPGSPNYDYRLMGTSPAIDQAAGSTELFDFERESRPFGNKSDIGTDEYSPVFLSVMPQDNTLRLNWQAETVLLPGLNHYEIHYTAEPGANNPAEGASPITVGNITGYTLTELTNYKNYTMYIEAKNGTNVVIGKSNVITIFPTDIHIYLPSVTK